MRRELTRVNGYFEVTVPVYSSGEFENHFRMTRETCQLLTQEIMHTGRIPTGNLSGRPAILPDKQMLLFLWSVANKEPYRTIADRPRHCTLGKENKPDISCEWSTKFSINPEIPSKRVHSKHIPKLSKTFSVIFTVPFSFGSEISEFFFEWKEPCYSLTSVMREPCASISSVYMPVAHYLRTWISKSRKISDQNRGISDANHLPWRVLRHNTNHSTDHSWPFGSPGTA